MSDICYLDCETTGVDPTRHVPWEIAIDVNDWSYSWILQLEPWERIIADPMALKVGGYYDRVRSIEEQSDRSVRNCWNIDDENPPNFVNIPQRRLFASWLVRAIGTRHIVGAVPAFDSRFVGDFLRRQSCVPVWHYHLVDVEALIAGHLGIQPPWNSKELSLAIGVDPEDFNRHTALGDVLWAKAMYEAVMRV